jgi:hypothetical protein
MVNAVALSSDGTKIAGASFYYPYSGTASLNTHGIYGTYFFDNNGNMLWKDEFTGDEGVYAVDVSQDGRIVASGGLLSGGKYGTPPSKGFFRIFDSSTGSVLFSKDDLPSRVNSIKLSATGDKVVLSTARELIVFDVKNRISATPVTLINTGSDIEAVDISSVGNWCICSDSTRNDGIVYLIDISNLSNPVLYTSPSVNAKHLITCDLSKGSDYFVAGGDNSILLFSKANIASFGPLSEYNPSTGSTSKAVRWVCISNDGKTVAAVINKKKAGILLILSNKNNKLKLSKKYSLGFNPNYVGMNQDSTKIVVADGYPDSCPGTFYLFDFKNKVIKTSNTSKMNWPICIIDNGSLLSGGSDDGSIYCFQG